MKTECHSEDIVGSVWQEIDRAVLTSAMHVTRYGRKRCQKVFNRAALRQCRGGL